MVNNNKQDTNHSKSKKVITAQTKTMCEMVSIRGHLFFW